jgi:hypothetical protein
MSYYIIESYISNKIKPDSDLGECRPTTSAGESLRVGEYSDIKRVRPASPGSYSENKRAFGLAVISHGYARLGVNTLDSAICRLQHCCWTRSSEDME